MGGQSGKFRLTEVTVVEEGPVGMGGEVSGIADVDLDTLRKEDNLDSIWSYFISL